MKEWYRFRTAAPAPTGWNVIKTLIQVCLFWTVFLAVSPWMVFRIEQTATEGHWTFAGSWATWTGIILFLAFSCLGRCSGAIMAAVGEGTPLPVDCANKLVARGPYSLVRNPMAIAGIGQGVSVGIALGSLAVILYALAGAVLWHFLVRPAEERDLQRRFGSDYERYRQNVPLWLPRLTPYVPTQTL